MRITLTLSEKLEDLIAKKGKKASVIAGEMEISESMISKYRNDKQPTLDSLVKLAKYFNVSTDYLLGLTDAPSADVKARAVEEYTGLSAESVEYLHRLRQQGNTDNTTMINFLLNDARYTRGIGRSVLEALRFFMEYDDKTPKSMQVHIDGAITEYSRNDRMIRSTAMKLDERIIENAVLEEIKRILIELKSAQRGDNNGKH